MVAKPRMDEFERKKYGRYYQATGRVLRNVLDGFAKNKKSQQDAAEVLGLSDHTPVSKILRGHAPFPIHYLLIWRDWLGAPGFWPLETWDEGLERRNRERETAGSPKSSHGPASKLAPVKD